MDARLIRLALVASIVSSMGASFSSPNFVVEAPTAELAQKVALTAERCRDEIAQDWLGHTLPRWFKPCQVRVKVGQIGAGGATTFAFDRGEVFGWNMNVQGTEERILDSVIPHEVSHTIFASHFRRPLPRWADEGAATLVEHESERQRQMMMLQQVFKTSQRIPLRQLLGMKEYPSDMQSVLTLYAQGYSLADFLVQNGGKARYLQFLEDAHRRDWNSALKSFYGLTGVDDLEKRWSGWVLAGSPALRLPEGEQLADAGNAVEEKPEVTVRSQNPEAVSAPQPRRLPVRQTRGQKGELQASLGQKSAAGDESLNNQKPAPRRSQRDEELFAEARTESEVSARLKNIRSTTKERNDLQARDNSAEEVHERVIVVLDGDTDADIERAALQLEQASRRLVARQQGWNSGWEPVVSNEGGHRRERSTASQGKQLPLTTLSVTDEHREEN